MYKLSYLPLANRDIVDAVNYIADELLARKAALDLLDALDKSISHLKDFPVFLPRLSAGKAFGTGIPHHAC